METRFVCPRCAATYSLQARANVKVQCPACGTLFDHRGTVPQSPGNSSASIPVAGRPPRLPAPGQHLSGGRLPNDAASVDAFIGDAVSPRDPRHRQKANDQSAMLGLKIGLGVTAAVLLVTLIAIIFRSGEPQRSAQAVSSKSTSTPPPNSSNDKPSPVGTQQISPGANSIAGSANVSPPVTAAPNRTTPDPTSAVASSISSPEATGAESQPAKNPTTISPEPSAAPKSTKSRASSSKKTKKPVAEPESKPQEPAAPRLQRQPTPTAPATFRCPS